MSTPTRTPGLRSGDLCQFGPGDYQVTHYRCNDHRDGTVTDVRTGAVVTKARHANLKGFRR